MRSKRTAQHLAVRAARAVGVALIVIPTIGVATAAADTGASPTPGPRELADAAKALADANTPWVSVDHAGQGLPREWTTSAMPTPEAKVATEHHAQPPRARRDKAPAARREAPRVAGPRADRPRTAHRPWRPSTTCRTTDGVWLVGPGDTLWGIARCTGTTVDQLRLRNGIRGDLLRLRQIVHIPAANR